MICNNDFSYIKNYHNLIEKGLLYVGIKQVRIDRYFTEEEKAKNRKMAEQMDSAVWSAHCEEMREKIGEEVEKLMNSLEKEFVFGQYKKPYPAEWDFWFYCRTIFDKTDYTKHQRDMSYITLSTQEVEEENEKTERLRRILENYPAKNIQAHFQYGIIKNEAAMEAEAEKIYTEGNGKTVLWCGTVEGKLEKRDGRYIFKKKRAKKYYSYVSPFDICANITI